LSTFALSGKQLFSFARVWVGIGVRVFVGAMVFVAVLAYVTVISIFVSVEVEIVSRAATLVSLFSLFEKANVKP
jgi:hypothetical protein